MQSKNRNNMTGIWCDYVGVPPWHPAYLFLLSHNATIEATSTEDEVGDAWKVQGKNESLP